MLKCSLLIPDTHRPFHNVKAYNLMLEVGATVGVDEVVILGDYADFYAVSSHSKDPRIFGMLQDEVVDVLAGLEEIDQVFKGTQRVYIEGNHEYRLERYLTDKAPALFGITSTQDVLHLRERAGWRFVSYEPDQAYHVGGSKLIARHEPPASNAKLAATKALCSVTYGHIHRIEESHIVGLDGTNHVAFSVGWLGNKNSPVFKYVKGHWQWQMGFGLVWTDPANGYFYHQKVHILDNFTCVVNGQKFKA